MIEYTRSARTTGLSRSRRVGAWLALSMLAAGTAACGGDRENPLRDGNLSGDSSLSRDLQLAGADSMVQPQLQDVPAETSAAPAPPPPRTVTRPPAPRPTPPRPSPATPTETKTPSGNVVTTPSTGGSSGAAGGAVGTVAAGTTLSLASTSRVCTNTTQVGDTFTATLTDAVSGSNGAVIPAGARVTLRATRLKRSENARDPIVMEFDVVSVAFGGQSYQVDGRVEYADIERVRNQPREKDVQKVVGGAVIGAIAGQVIGKNTKGTVVGGAAGAAAGAAAAAATANYEGCVGEGKTLRVVLASGLQVRA